MHSTGYFRSRNLRRYNERQSEERSKLIDHHVSARIHLRSNSSFRNESGLYKSALVFDNRENSKEILHNFNIDCKRQIASLTKIMTCFTALQFIKAHQIIPEDFQCQVSKEAAELKGTSAGLEEGNIISLWDLLHGLMLPSGNDAAYCIAQNLGRIFISSAKKGFKQGQLISPRSRSRRKQLGKRNSQIQVQPIQAFVKEMNKNAQKLQMTSSRYNNPHGLADAYNYSTSRDQLLLIQVCLKNSHFQRIVKTKLYFGYIKLKGQIWTRQIIWQNTNRLLCKGYQGIKTGNTGPAGYCLASWYCTGEANLIIIILGCPSKEERDIQTMKLTNQNTKIV